MRIGIDVRPLQTGHRYRGIGRYLYGRLKALKKTDITNKYFLFIDKKLSGGDHIKEEFSGKNFIIKELFFSFPIFIDKIFLNILTSQFVLPIEIRKNKLDIFYSFDYFVPVFQGAKFIITIYGLNPFSIDRIIRREMEKKFKPVNNILDWVKVFLKNFQNYLLKKIIFKRIKASSAIVTSSDNSKEDIMNHLSILDSKVFVVPEGVDLSLFRPANNTEINFIKEKYKIKYPYFLFVSAVEWLKNVYNMIRGYILAREKFTFPHQLVIAGIHGSGFDVFRKMVRDRNLEEEIIFTGYISDKDIIHLYSGAEGYILPSFYEGFPMTAFEAMACGCPVLASKTSSMPETIGNAGLYFDPKKPEEISLSLVKIERDKILKRRLIEKGFNLAKEFTWENSTKKLVKVFDEIIINKHETE